MSDYLKDDLVIEIFTRLPPKSLLRFRTLSKSWYFCIGSPSFIRMHALRSTQKLLFRHHIHYNGSGEIKDFHTLNSDDFYTLHSEDRLPLCPIHGYDGITGVHFPCTKNFGVVGACNGIFCIREYPKDIFLWNPSIRRKLSIPDCPWRKSGVPWAGIGFGFDPVNDDYKIVSISFARKSSYVYLVKTNSWCVIASPTPLIYDYLSVETCYLNGLLHWVVDCYHTESHDVDIPCIMTFDLNTHVFGMIPLPACFRRAAELRSIQGSLAVISSSHDDDNWIWVRRDDSWSVVFNSKEKQFKGGLIIGVLQMTTNSDLLINSVNKIDQVRVCNASSYILEQVHVCNAITGVQSRLVDFGASSYVFEAHQWVESLYLLDMVTACEANQKSIERKNDK